MLRILVVCHEGKICLFVPLLVSCCLRWFLRRKLDQQGQGNERSIVPTSGVPIVPCESVSTPGTGCSFLSSPTLSEYLVTERKILCHYIRRDTFHYFNHFGKWVYTCPRQHRHRHRALWCPAHADTEPAHVISSVNVHPSMKKMSWQLSVCKVCKEKRWLI